MAGRRDRLTRKGAMSALAPAKWLWHKLVSESVRTKIYRARRAIDLSVPLIFEPTYSDDGLSSQHVVGFMTDRRFLDAYNWARAGVPWKHPGEIHFSAHNACWAAEHAMSVEGDFVECGVNYGILCATICRFLDFSRQSKRFYLYDTYGGVPIETLYDPVEIENAKRLNELHYQGDILGFLKKRFSGYSNIEYVKGALPNSLLQSMPDKIAYLSIDLTNAPAEIGSIEILWPRLSQGAVVLLNDYAYGPEFANQKREWDKFTAKMSHPILTLGTGQGMIIKSH